MVPAEELPVLDALVQIRHKLTKLKKDKNEYIKAQDVLAAYSQLMEQVHKLGIIRANQAAENASNAESNGTTELSSNAESKEITEEPENRLDTLLNDNFHLLSLFFLTIGKNRESPATFCQLSTMKRLLLHLTESKIYTEADLRPYQSRLAELREIITTPLSLITDIQMGSSDEVLYTQEVELQKTLLQKWNFCHKLLEKLQDALGQLDPELAPIHQKLVTLRRLLASIAARHRPAASDVVPILNELRLISDQRVDGQFIVDGKAPVKGQELCAGLLEDNFEIALEIKAKDGEQNVMKGSLGGIYERLTDLKGQLERLVLTHRWTLRETDLYNYQMSLRELDQMRVNGKFVDSEGAVPNGQLVLLYLLRRCYGLCYRLISSSEPISEQLMPIANKLETVKKCLIEVQKYGGPYSTMDLYPYQLVLSQVDNMRVNGMFMGRDGSIPEGQGILNALLSEAHELISVMQQENEDEQAFDTSSEQDSEDEDIKT